MKIALVTDAWFPQVSGVVRTFSTTVEKLRGLGHDVQVYSPDMFRSIPCPTYPDIRLAIGAGSRLARMLDEFAPDAIHVGTEGTLGLSGRNYCARRGYPFTTSFATKFPEYIHARTLIPTRWTYALIRWFHRPSAAVMVTTESVRRELAEKGFGNLVMWTRGVDVDLFKPRDKNFLADPRPVLLYMGRVAVEKNIKAFLDLDVAGTKYVVGGGPQLDTLSAAYPHVHFTGMKHGEELARYTAAADVLVFPSLTDTFGLVMLEALACGVPVAAFPVTGPLDVIGGTGVGVLDDDLARATRAALEIPAATCREFAMQYSWDNVARIFLGHLAPITRAD
jgi:glycosyltransferase involved in cell wall biosynthesis